MPPEEQPMKLFRLPQGRRVWIASASGREARFISREIFKRHCYEKHGVVVSHGDVIFDVGANVGLFTLSLMERFCDLRIYCFEPVPGTYVCLTRNLEESPQRAQHKVTALKLALGAADGQTNIEYFPRAPGNSTLYSEEKRREFGAILDEASFTSFWKVDKLRALLFLPLFPIRRQVFGRMVERTLSRSVVMPCPVRTVSGMIRENGVERIDLLKIDVEGAEMDVLAGIEQCHWPLIRQLSMEVAPANKDQVPALTDRLRSLGFGRVELEGELGGPANLDDPLSCLVYAIRTIDGGSVGR